MITPTIGRVVLFHPGDAANVPGFTRLHNMEPMAALVAFVHDERLVNLSVMDHIGVQHSRTMVRLLQDNDVASEKDTFCHWMPYQLGQAAKTEAVLAEQRRPDPDFGRAPFLEAGADRQREGGDTQKESSSKVTGIGAGAGNLETSGSNGGQAAQQDRAQQQGDGAAGGGGGATATQGPQPDPAAGPGGNDQAQHA